MNCLSVFDHFVKLALKGLSSQTFVFRVNLGTSNFVMSSWALLEIRGSTFDRFVKILLSINMQFGQILVQLKTAFPTFFILFIKSRVIHLLSSTAICYFLVHDVYYFCFPQCTPYI